ncbi:MAG: L-threonylcarbamoyladenylate synthase [bacterium]
MKNIKKVSTDVSTGGIVAFPTDTVYGLGTNFLNPDSINRIYKIKGRSFNKPLVLMIANRQDLQNLAVNISESVYRIIDNFWPGPLTLIFNSSTLVQMLTGKKTVAVRMPGHPMLLEFLKCCPKPLATTSANISGKESCLKASQVKKLFEKKIDYILNGGETKYKKESTILDVSAYPYNILREGVITKKDLNEFF